MLLSALLKNSRTASPTLATRLTTNSQFCSIHVTATPFPFHFHSVGSLRGIPGFSGISLHDAQLSENSRKTLSLLVVAPTGFEPVFQP